MVKREGNDLPLVSQASRNSRGFAVRQCPIFVFLQYEQTRLDMYGVSFFVVPVARS